MSNGYNNNTLAAQLLLRKIEPQQYPLKINELKSYKEINYKILNKSCKLLMIKSRCAYEIFEFPLNTNVSRFPV